jgi:nanoRNase/pAp phosphatase (c-di-AMP/oligoRNAs hydrolase)
LIDVAKIAERFGGGGHWLASDCTLDDTTLDDARQRVLAAVAAALDASL